MFLILFSIKGYSQWTFDGDVNTQAYVSQQTSQPYLDLVADFGANPNDELDDTWAFIKAAWFLRNEADINGVRHPAGTSPTVNINYATQKVRLVIPTPAPGKRYLVGLQLKQNEANFDNIRPAANTCGYDPATSTTHMVVYEKYSDFFTSSNSSTYPDAGNDATFKINLIRELVQSVVGATYPLAQITKYKATTNTVCPSLVYWQPYVVSRCTCTAATLPVNVVSYDPNSNCSASTLTNYNAYWYNMTLPYAISAPSIFNLWNNAAPNASPNPNPIQKIEIVGGDGSLTTRPMIVYQNGYLGIADAIGTPYNQIDDIDDINTKVWHPDDAFCRQPSMFHFVNIENVCFRNLDINGSLGSTQLLGWRHDKYQLGHNALLLFTRNTSVLDVELHHMGLDGIIISNNKCDEPANFYGNNIYSHHNHRMGITMSSGEHVIINNSRFNENGTTPNTTSQQAQGVAWVRPCAGLDVEYNGNFGDAGDCFTTSVLSNHRPIQDVEFNSCEFNFNKGSCVANDVDDATISNVKMMDIRFNNCTFHKVKGSSPPSSPDFYGMYLTGPDLKFDHCAIYTPVLAVSKFEDHPTMFYDCTFEDKPNGMEHWEGGAHLLELQSAKKTLFERCVFKVNDDYRRPFYLLNDPTQPSTWAIFKDCDFIYNNKGTMLHEDLLFGVKFKGKNIFNNIYTGVCPHHNINIFDAFLEGSDDYCNPNEVTAKRPAGASNHRSWQILRN